MAMHINVKIDEILQAAQDYPDCQYLQQLAKKAKKSRERTLQAIKDEAKKKVSIAWALAMLLLQINHRHQSEWLRKRGYWDEVRLLRNTKILKAYGCFYYSNKTGWQVEKNWQEILEKFRR